MSSIEAVFAGGNGGSFCAWQPAGTSPRLCAARRIDAPALTGATGGSERHRREACLWAGRIRVSEGKSHDNVFPGTKIRP
jgi:hypothetical protein